MGLLTTVFPSMPGVAKIINDNHCADPHNQISPKIVGQNISSQNISRAVYSRTAVIPVPIVVGPGQPQQKGLVPIFVRNKACQKCFFCLSLSFCPSCTKCPQCCRKSSCGRQVTKVLGNLAQPGFKSSGGLHFEGRLQPPIQDEAPIDQVSSDSQRICQSSQKQVLEGGVAVPDCKTSHRKSSGSGFSCLLQPAVHSSQTKQQMASNLGFEQTQSFPPLRNLKNGNSRDHPNFPSKRRMGHIAGFQRCLFPYSHQPKVEEVSQVASARSNLPVQGSVVRPSNGSFGIYKGGEGGETDGPVQGYKDPPVPRRLVASSSLSGDLCKPNPDPDGSVPAVGTCTPTGVQLSRLSFRPLQGSSKTDSGEVASPNSENKDANEQTAFCPRVHISHRFVDGHRETGGLRSPSHETESLARARGSRGDFSPQLSVSSSAVVARRNKA